MCSYGPCELCDLCDPRDLAFFSDADPALFNQEDTDTDADAFALAVDPESVPRSPDPEPEPDWDELLRALAE